jgi:hypothetical protein
VVLFPVLLTLLAGAWATLLPRQHAMGYGESLAQNERIGIALTVVSARGHFISL